MDAEKLDKIILRRLAKSVTYKGWRIETTGENYTRTDFNTGKSVTTPTPESTEVRVTTPQNELLSTFFDSVEEAKKYIDRRK